MTQAQKRLGKQHPSGYDLCSSPSSCGSENEGARSVILAAEIRSE